MAEMGWLSPMALWHLAWLLPGLCLLSIWGAWRRRRRLAPLLGQDPTALQAKTTLSPGRRRIRFLLFLAATALIVVALARPYWGLRILPFSGSGRDIMIVLDVSRSMLADDLKPSRLEHAKWLLRELIMATPGDRYGIVAFAGEAFLQCPLTADRNSLFLYLDELGPESVPVGGTHIERALREALAAFAAAEGGHRAVLLVTDGDELSGDSQGVVEELVRRRLPLFAVGLGDPAGSGLVPVPSADGKARTLLRDRQGELVVSRLNEASLRSLALATPDGLYLRSTVTDSGLDALRQRVHRLVPEQYATGERQRPIERFPVPLTAALVLLLARLAIGERRRMGAATLAAILLACSWTTPLPAQGPLADEIPPPAAMEPPGESGEAATTPPMAEPPRPSWQEYNQALELQEKDQLAEARQHYERAINAAVARPEVRARAWRNLGVAAHREAREALSQDPKAALRSLATAEEAYREALRVSAADPAGIARNQQLLLADRRRAEETIRQLQDMRDRQREAAEQTRDAHDQQQQANADGSPEKTQAAQDQAEEAGQATEQYRQAAEKAGQGQAAEAARQAADAIRQAQEAQSKHDGQAAEEHLARAMQALGADQDGDPQPPPQDGQDGGQADRPRDDARQPPPQEGGGDDLSGDPGEPGEEIPEPDPGEIDPRQAATLLDLMAEQEKDLREALLERRRREARIKPVDKDW